MLEISGTSLCAQITKSPISLKDHLSTKEVFCLIRLEKF